MALLKVDAGDLIAVPARNGASVGYVIARVLSDGDWVVLEVFSQFRDGSVVDFDWLKDWGAHLGERMFSPIRASLNFNKYFGKQKWPVLKCSVMASIDPDLSISDLEWEGPPDQYDALGLYYRGDSIKYEPEGVRRSLESGHLYTNPQLLRRIDLHLRGVMGPMQALNYRVERDLIRRFGAEECRQETLSWVERSDVIMNSLVKVKQEFDRYNKVIARNIK